MQRLFLTICLVVAGAIAAGAQDTSRGSIEGTIQSQIEAFQVDDFAAAFAIASPAIRRIFRNPETFGLMVRQGYPMVWRPSAVRFLDLREFEGRKFQKVLVRDQAGVFHLLEYQMIEADGGWQINGVQLLPGPESAA